MPERRIRKCYILLTNITNKWISRDLCQRIIIFSGIIPAAFLKIPETGLQSDYVYFETPKNIPHIQQQTFPASPSKLKIISIQEIPLASSFEKTSKLRERLSMMGLIDRESYIPETITPSSYNERLDSYLQKLNDKEMSYLTETKTPSSFNERLNNYLQKLKQNSQVIPEKTPGNTRIEEVTANLFRQANDSKYLNEDTDDEYHLPEAGSYHEGMTYNDNLKTVGASGINMEETTKPSRYNERLDSYLQKFGQNSHHEILEKYPGNTRIVEVMNTGSFENQGRPFSGIVTPPSGNINIHAYDTNKELYRGDINSDISTEAGFEDTMGRIAGGKDVPEAEGDEGVKVQSLESILKLVGGGKTPPWVKKVDAAPVRVEATDYRTNFSEELCTLWPENLQWSAKAVRASLLVAQDMGDVKTFAKSKYLGLHVENITETAKEASFHIVLAIDLRGAPVMRAVRSAEKAVGAAVAGSEAALRVATEYATSPGARFAQLVLKAAQRADDAAQIAKDIIRNVNLNE